MTEAIVAIIVALGGTAGIVKIIQAIKGSTEDIRGIVHEEYERSSQEIINEIDNLKKAFETNKETDLAILRNTITHLYYKYLKDKAMPAYERENLVSLYNQYTSLDGNSYIHQLYEEMLKWEVITNEG